MTLGEHDAWTVAAFVHAVAEVTRSLSQSTPAPRGMPFFGLDMRVHEPALLDEFCRHGIFRKYERVLVVGCGLGGAARWWAARFGCTVVGIDRHPPVTRGATVLSRRAGLTEATVFATAREDAVPLRPESVTHAWIRDLSHAVDPACVLRETYAALRPGGHVTAEARMTNPEMMRAYREQARKTGFIAIETRPVPLVEAPRAFLTALSQLESFVGRMSRGTVEPALRSLVASIRRTAQESQPTQQLLAQRPS
jgi:SAM-dependent methyltransferase